MEGNKTCRKTNFRQNRKRVFFPVLLIEPDKMQSFTPSEFSRPVFHQHFVCYLCLGKKKAYGMVVRGGFKLRMRAGCLERKTISYCPSKVSLHWTKSSLWRLGSVTRFQLCPVWLLSFPSVVSDPCPVALCLRNPCHNPSLYSLSLTSACLS